MEIKKRNIWITAELTIYRFFICQKKFSIILQIKSLSFIVSSPTHLCFKERVNQQQQQQQSLGPKRISYK